MNGTPDSDRDTRDPPAGGKPKSFEDISISERWAPLVRDSNDNVPIPAKLGQRIIASALSLVVLGLILWALA